MLVAEDDPEIRRVLVELLSDAGYAVAAVSSVGEALRELEASPGVELLVLDHWLPDGTGAEVCRTAKAASGRALPCLMFSASAQNEALARAAGADDWMTKPFDVDQLLQRVTLLMVRPRRFTGNA